MSSGHPHPPGEGCLARSVADTLAEEPTLEAVTFDAAQQKLSVATLGRADVERLTQRLTGKIQAAQGADPGRTCSLLSGQGDCGTCESPLSEAELKRITIQRTRDTTTIARVTCPTAPKFWRWRDLPFPRIEPRTLEIPEDDHDHHHADEWKLQLASAVACGVCGLLAAFVLPAHYKVFAFVAAYLAGGFYPAEEVWERLQKRVLDVHFLMLAVAVGAACIGAWAEGATLLFLFSFSARWNITRWAAHKKKSVPCSVTPPKRRSPLMPAAMKLKFRSRACAPEEGCSSSPARNFRWTWKLSRVPRRRMNPISPARRRPWKRRSATAPLPAPSIFGARWRSS
jgi:hypothetical protein